MKGKERPARDLRALEQPLSEVLGLDVETVYRVALLCLAAHLGPMAMEMSWLLGAVDEQLESWIAAVTGEEGEGE